jgi:hypothetical protein
LFFYQSNQTIKPTTSSIFNFCAKPIQYEEFSCALPTAERLDCPPRKGRDETWGIENDEDS